MLLSVSYYCRYLMALIPALVISSCVVPTLEKEPYPEDNINGLVESQITREQIESEFGPPQARRFGDRYWIYGKSRMVAHGILPDPIIMIPYYETFIDYNWMVITFDNEDKVIGAELVEDFEGCSRMGICLKGSEAISYSETQKHQYSLTADAIFTATVDMDKEAKQFHIPHEGCGVYYYSKTNDFPAVMFNLEKKLPISDSTYGFEHLRPGTYDIGVDESCPQQKKCIAKPIRLLCSESELHFVKIDTKSQWQWTWVWNERKPLEFIIEIVDQENGRKEINERRLRLPK